MEEFVKFEQEEKMLCVQMKNIQVGKILWSKSIRLSLIPFLF